ncbi:MAG: hypothetical protein ACTII7_03700 [Galactobacter sp.]
MSLTQRLQAAAQEVERGRALASAAVTPRWKGAAASRFDDRRAEFELRLIQLGAAVQAAQAITAQFERAWRDEAAQRAVLGRGSVAGLSP